MTVSPAARQKAVDRHPPLGSVDSLLSVVNSDTFKSLHVLHDWCVLKDKRLYVVGMFSFLISNSKIRVSHDWFDSIGRSISVI